jgi:hypothetical protein
MDEFYGHHVKMTRRHCEMGRMVQELIEVRVRHRDKTFEKGGEHRRYDKYLFKALTTTKHNVCHQG